MPKTTIAEYRVRAGEVDAAYPGVALDEIVATLNASDDTALNEFDESMLRREVERLRRVGPDKAARLVEQATVTVEQVQTRALARARGVRQTPVR